MIKTRRDVFCQNYSRLCTKWGEKRQEPDDWNSIIKEAWLEMQEQVNIINKRWREMNTICGQDTEVGSYSCYGHN